MSSGVAPVTTSGPSSNPPKKSLSDLTQPELLSKCQTLLSLAQKSKAAKDDAVSKVNYMLMYLIKQLPIQLAEGALKSLVEGAQVEIFFDLAQEILKIEIRT